jgi:hypothetical protein
MNVIKWTSHADRLAPHELEAVSVASLLGGDTPRVATGAGTVVGRINDEGTPELWLHHAEGHVQLGYIVDDAAPIAPPKPVDAHGRDIPELTWLAFQAGYRDVGELVAALRELRGITALVTDDSGSDEATPSLRPGTRS